MFEDDHEEEEEEEDSEEDDPRYGGLRIADAHEDVAYDSEQGEHWDHDDDDGDDDDDARYGGLRADVHDPVSSTGDNATAGYDQYAEHHDNDDDDAAGAAPVPQQPKQRKSILQMMGLTETLKDSMFSSDIGGADGHAEQDDDDAAHFDALRAADGDDDDDAPPELMYFDAAGKAELTRLAFAAGGVAFKDVRLSREQFVELKADSMRFGPATRFGQLPILRHGHLLLAQSQAIAQYAAELGGLGCKGKVLGGRAPLTARERALDLMYVGVRDDVLGAGYAAANARADDGGAAQARYAEIAGRALDKIEQLLPLDTSACFVHGGGALATDGPGLADLAVFDLVTSPGSGAAARDVFLPAAYPKISALVARVQAYPTLQPYFAARGF